jgi:hypothetical protein
MWSWIFGLHLTNTVSETPLNWLGAININCKIMNGNNCYLYKQKQSIVKLFCFIIFSFFSILFQINIPWISLISCLSIYFLIFQSVLSLIYFIIGFRNCCITDYCIGLFSKFHGPRLDWTCWPICTIMSTFPWWAFPSFLPPLFC